MNEIWYAVSVRVHSSLSFYLPKAKSRHGKQLTSGIGFEPTALGPSRCMKLRKLDFLFSKDGGTSSGVSSCFEAFGVLLVGDSFLTALLSLAGEGVF